MAQTQIALGNGNAAEALMDVGASIAVPPGQSLCITDYIGTYEGAGRIRIRLNNLVGQEAFRLRFAADGTIIGDIKNGEGLCVVTNTDPKNPLPVVVTQDGNFKCSLVLIYNFIFGPPTPP